MSTYDRVFFERLSTESFDFDIELTAGEEPKCGDREVLPDVILLSD